MVQVSDVIHPTAFVSSEAQIGPGIRVWHHCQVRERAVVGANCILGKGVYVDAGVIIGNNVKVQNGASLYRGVTLEDGVFIGPHACLTNDCYPRAITPQGRLKTDKDWEAGLILVKYGASIGAGAIILPNVTIGRFAMVGAGSVVTHDVPDHGLALGVPARLVGHVCSCGRRLAERGRAEQAVTFYCAHCTREITLPINAESGGPST
ncbi:MAG: N-acetyltransferase [Chloroflexi bacterium]|nr:N-acetyltransferase [Chloroflexota bacterium]